MAVVTPAGNASSAAAVSVFGRTGIIVAADGDYYGVVAAAKTGATAASRYVGATTGGAPVAGTFVVGDFVIDRTGKVFICTAAGTPGTWGQVGGSVSSVFTRSGAVVAADGDYYGVVAAAKTGATAASRYVGATASVAPTTGTFAVGDFVITQTGKVYICTTAGSPGTWTQVGAGAVSLTSSCTFIGGDVTMFNANQFYDVADAGSLAAGTWLLIADAEYQSGGNGAGNVNLQIKDTTNTLVLTQNTAPFSSGGSTSVHTSCTAVLAGAATIKSQAASTAPGDNIKARAASNNSGTNIATKLTAVKIA